METGDVMDSAAVKSHKGARDIMDDIVYNQEKNAKILKHRVKLCKNGHRKTSPLCIYFTDELLPDN